LRTSTATPPPPFKKMFLRNWKTSIKLSFAHPTYRGMGTAGWEKHMTSWFMSHVKVAILFCKFVFKCFVQYWFQELCTINKGGKNIRQMYVSMQRSKLTLSLSLLNFYLQKVSCTIVHISLAKVVIFLPFVSWKKFHDQLRSC